MTVYCPKCGSANLWPMTDPVKIDEEVNQVLMQQWERCFSCKHQWNDRWWEIWTPEGIEKVTVRPDGTLGQPDLDTTERSK